MKLELLLRKAAPFLLIAILIACLLNMPQKEGMKVYFFKKPELQPELQPEEEEMSKVDRLKRDHRLATFKRINESNESAAREQEAANKFIKGKYFREKGYSPDAWEKFKSQPERLDLKFVRFADDLNYADDASKLDVD